MMLGAGEPLPPLINTITLRDDRQSPEILASTRARYPISGHLRREPVRDRGLIWALPRRFLSPPPTLQQIPTRTVAIVFLNRVIGAPQIAVQWLTLSPDGMA